MTSCRGIDEERDHRDRPPAIDVQHNAQAEAARYSARRRHRLRSSVFPDDGVCSEQDVRLDEGTERPAHVSESDRPEVRLQRATDGNPRRLSMAHPVVVAIGPAAEQTGAAPDHDVTVAASPELVDLFCRVTSGDGGGCDRKKGAVTTRVPVRFRGHRPTIGPAPQGEPGSRGSPTRRWPRAVTKRHPKRLFWLRSARLMPARRWWR